MRGFWKKIVLSSELVISFISGFRDVPRRNFFVRKKRGGNFLFFFFGDFG